MKKFILPLTLAALALSANFSLAGPPDFVESIGLRGGWDAESDVDLTEVSLFVLSPELKSWRIGAKGALGLSVEGQVGHLSGEGDSAAFFTLGPRITYSREDWPIRFSLASGPAYYTGDEFDGYDLGDNFEFVSSIGFDLALDERWSVGYRFQHTSNGGFGDENPGLDMHLLEAGYRF